MPDNILAVKTDENQSLESFFLYFVSLEAPMPQKAETLAAGFFALINPRKSKGIYKKARMIERM